MSLVVAGNSVPCRAEVLSWLEHGMTWSVGECGVRRRTRAVDIIVWHATAAEHGGRTVHANLTRRDLSVEFVIDAIGTVWQFLDPARFRAAHVGGLSDRSVGIEIQNTVYPISPNPRHRPIVPRIVQVCSPGPPFGSDWTTDKHGTRLYYRKSRRIDGLGCLPPQLDAVRALGESLSGAMGVPLRLADPRDYVPLAEREALRGHLAHVQVSLRHSDPSTDVLEVWR